MAAANMLLIGIKMWLMGDVLLTRSVFYMLSKGNLMTLYKRLMLASKRVAGGAV